MDMFFGEEEQAWEEQAWEDAGEDVGHVEVQEKPGEGGANNSLILCFIGCILFPLFLVLLGWNEKTTVCESKMLMQAEQDTIIADCGDADAVEGQFVFFSCPIDSDSLTEFTPMSFNTPGLQELVKFKSSAGAQRIEMYQCIETKEERESEKSSFLERAGNQTSALFELASDTLTQSTRRRRSDVSSTTITTYRYGMDWTAAHYKSQDFKGTPENIKAAGCPDFIYNGQVNHNPEAPNRGDGEKASLGTQLVHATSVKAGAFTVGDETLMKKFDANHTISLDPFKQSFGLPASTDNVVNALTPNSLAVHADSPNYLSTCKSNRLGCLRISYSSNSASHISVMGKVGASGNVEPFPTDKSWGCGEDSFIRMYTEEMTKEDMIAKMKGENEARTWAIRIVGLFACWIAMWCCLEPISSAADAVGDILSYIPILGEALESLLEGVVDFIVCFISCSIGCCCGLLVIAIVWVAMRPVVGGPLMGGCVVLGILAIVACKMSVKDPKRMRKKKKLQGWQGQGGKGYGATWEGGQPMYA